MARWACTETWDVTMPNCEDVGVVLGALNRPFPMPSMASATPSIAYDTVTGNVISQSWAISAQASPIVLSQREPKRSERRPEIGDRITIASGSPTLVVNVR